ncbi:hypothetical protein, partial [Paenibacillus alkalitolerans]|uniref:hypothetical protein n=1 Tax=Paenibacillus alkalitolerans TaxID=2799335 RepID=UPI001F33615F
SLFSFQGTSFGFFNRHRFSGDFYILSHPAYTMQVVFSGNFNLILPDATSILCTVPSSSDDFRNSEK